MKTQERKAEQQKMLRSKHFPVMTGVDVRIYGPCNYPAHWEDTKDIDKSRVVRTGPRPRKYVGKRRYGRGHNYWRYDELQVRPVEIEPEHIVRVKRTRL